MRMRIVKVLLVELMQLKECESDKLGVSCLFSIVYTVLGDSAIHSKRLITTLSVYIYLHNYVYFHSPLDSSCKHTNHIRPIPWGTLPNVDYDAVHDSTGLPAGWSLLMEASPRGKFFTLASESVAGVGR